MEAKQRRMAEHTPEPWTTSPADNGIDVLYDRDGQHFANFRPVVFRHPGPGPGDDAARAVACVNACAGIDDPKLALAAARQAAEWSDLIAQDYPDMAGLNAALKVLRAAIGGAS